MKYTHHDLGYRIGGEIVVITLSLVPAFVRLMDTPNLQNFKTGKKHSYHGGQVESKSVRLQIPHAGHWHITIDLGGNPGTVRSSVRVYPKVLSPLNEASLLSVPSLVRVIDTAGAENLKFDVFIFHASEDRQEIGVPLANALQKHRLRSSLDGFGIKLGDIRRRIDVGIANSRLAIVILSQAFLKKGLTNDELDSLATRASTGEQIVLPLWHDVSRQEIAKLSPSLASKLARSTSAHSLEEIAAEISEAIKYSKIQEARRLTIRPKDDKPDSKHTLSHF